MKNELLEALTILEQEKNISKDTLIEAIENSLVTACKNHFGKSDNVRVDMDPETCEYHVYQAKTVVEEVEDPVLEVSLAKAKMIDSKYELGDTVNFEIKSQEFGRIATQNAKNVILQKIREEERKVLFSEYYSKEKDIVTGIVQRNLGRNVSINLGKVDAILTENEQVRGEVFQPTERIKLYILEVKSTPKGPKILVSRTHPELVKRLFESEVTEVRDGIVEIRSIAREAGSRTKIAVYSNDPDVDAVGACVGMNGARVNAIVNELRGEKIDIINWNGNPAMLIENALSPAKVISVIADAEEKSAKVVVPDYQLSLAIGKEGQNARLAARLTGFKIDIKSETQAREAGDFMDYENDYEDEEYYEDGNEYYGDDYEDGEYARDGYADGAYADGEYAGDGYAESEYADGAYTDGAYTGDGYSEGAYTEDGYADSEYADGAYTGDGYSEGAYTEDGYADGEYADGEYTGDGYSEGEYTEDGSYVDGEYTGDGSYADGEYTGDGSYADGEYTGDGSYADGEYTGDGSYVDGEYTGDGSYADGEYTGDGSYADGEYTGDGSYADGEYTGDGSYADGEYTGDGSYADSEYTGDGSYADGEYTGDGSYAEGEYTGDGYTESEYADEEYTGEK